MPQEYVEYSRLWAELNPDWHLAEWGMKDLGLFPEMTEVFNHLAERDAGRCSIEYYVQVADVMGYAIVEKFGGFYVNCDMQPLRPLSDLAIPSHAWASYENHEDGRIVNAAIGSPMAHDPFWIRMCAGLPERYFANPYDEMVMTTGPGYLTDVAHQFPEELFVYDVETFNPIHWKQIPMGGDASGFEYPSQSIAVHHWAHRKDHRTNLIEGATP